MRLLLILTALSLGCVTVTPEPEPVPDPPPYYGGLVCLQDCEAWFDWAVEDDAE